MFRRQRLSWVQKIPSLNRYSLSLQRFCTLSEILTVFGKNVLCMLKIVSLYIFQISRSFQRFKRYPKINQPFFFLICFISQFNFVKFIWIFIYFLKISKWKGWLHCYCISIYYCFYVLCVYMLCVIHCYFGSSWWKPGSHHGNPMMSPHGARLLTPGDTIERN